MSQTIQIHGGHTTRTAFFGSATPFELTSRYGSPLYVYNETILRQRCREIAHLVDYERFSVNFSAKSNSNPALLRIVRSEGLKADAMSPGEICMDLAAGFTPDDIFFISNNVSAQEFEFAADRGVRVSVDSLSQLELFGSVNPGGSVAVRLNPGVGAGHHKKVVTGGKETKFGIAPEDAETIADICARHRLTLRGINQHIGSLFMEGDAYLAAAARLLELAEGFGELDFIDFGGGFGVPYRKLDGQGRLDLAELGRGLTALIRDWTTRTGRKPEIMVEPGRYISAECGVLLGTVHAVKANGPTHFAGTDLGFNVLARPMLYDSHHDIELHRLGGEPLAEPTPVTVVGNICESGDIIARDRMLPAPRENDILAVLDAGAYGHAMSSNYNLRLRPAEVLVAADGSHSLIRRRDSLDDLLAPYRMAV
ncbi:diaminopimelate decarboxylase [Desulfobaculum xiamenense]|uniref:Diaminopimelate decarboxylase n=1 Tax=Desulfobaculum xiamenense TaxID=995050 RepID=A0A846QKI7_9BACT|nr:diaminopimelate decarboxylase [Desulfobaculum xiamenense]NJB67570.1 diaminopimelate decarboxylase [Desulfobaculum xiamenense]